MLLRLTLALLALSAAHAFAEGEPTPEALNKQFDAQVARLVERDYPKMFGDSTLFDRAMNRLREAVVAYVPAKPGYTFLIVIPKNHAPLTWQVKQIVLPTGEVCEFRESRLIFRERLEIENRNGFKTPTEPYLLYDVSNGDNTAGRWVCDVIPEFENTRRRGLTVEECVALLVQRPEMLGTRKVAAVGTVIVDRNHPNQSEQFARWQIDLTANRRNPYVNIAPWTAFNRSPGDAWSGWGLVGYQFPSCAVGTSCMEETQ